MNYYSKGRPLKVNLAKSKEDREAAMTLRYNVFNVELKEGLPSSHATQKDKDEYDEYCEHLTVVNIDSNLVVGTYRILLQSVAEKGIGFYSENEFSMDRINCLPGEAAEVGRSCIHPDYRDGSVISLLWNGLAEYIKEKNVRYLMGCASTHTKDVKILKGIQHYLRQKNALIDESYELHPKNPIIPAKSESDIMNGDCSKEITTQIPPLIKGYVRLGSKVCGNPSFDPIFQTTDYFILFDRNLISKKYGSHYKI